MKRNIVLTALIALPISLSGCDKTPGAPKVDAPMVAAPSDTMSGMAMPAGSKMGKGSGTVAAVDQANGKITLDHGAIPTVGWPAMKMGFSAKPNLLKSVAVGDKIDFDVMVTDKGGEITAIKKQ